MSDNPQQWDEQEQWLYIQPQGRRGQTAQSSSNGSYSPDSSTSDVSSLSHGSYHWSSGAAAFDGPPVTAWTGPRKSLTLFYRAKIDPIYLIFLFRP